MRLIAALCTTLLLTACAEPMDPEALTETAQTPRKVRSQARTFAQVARTVEPVAEAECRARTSGRNCDYLIVVDDNPRLPPNAAQTLDRSGRPVIIFTQTLINRTRNADELAFVMAHEAAHHIANHIGRQRVNANLGAQVLAGLVGQSGGSSQAVELATQLGASVGARSFSKEFELEADRLGAVIAHTAGFDPVKGANFFARLPDPGDRFLGTHPPNAARQAAVRQVAAGL